VLAWLDRPGRGAALLRKLVTAETAISHEALDALPNPTRVVAVRQMLVHVGVLAARAEHLDRLPTWMNRLLADAPDHHRQLLRAYGSWSVLRRARHRARQSRFTAASAHNARTKIRIALAFLTWLDRIDVPLHQVRQAHVEQWLDSGRPIRRRINDFLKWTNRRGLTDELGVHPLRPAEPDLSMTDDDRWQLLRRCIDDRTLPVDVRAAGALLLLYELPVSRISALRHDDLVTHGGRPHLLVEGHRTLLPPAVDALLRAAMSDLRTTSAVAAAVDDVRWLFPSRMAGLPMSAAGMAAKPRRHAIPIRRARNAALISLAADLPAAALSALLGLSISGAVRWTHRAKRDWHAFIEARTISEPQRRPPRD
jgi:hypothetical protein